MNTTVFQTLFDHYYEARALLDSSPDYVAKTLLVAFDAKSEESFLILPRQALSLESLNAAREENDDLDVFLATPYDKPILLHLMTAWQECKNAGYVAEYPNMDKTRYTEIPYFITDLGKDKLDEFCKALSKRAAMTP